jgi:arginine N-succinyltransferase
MSTRRLDPRPADSEAAISPSIACRRGSLYFSGLALVGRSRFNGMVLDFVLRPVGEHDLPGLRHLADVIQDGLTTLPPEESALEDRINQSLRAFDRRIKKAGGDHYLFVLEEVGSGAVFYTYEVRRERLVHQALGIDHEMDVLHLKLDHKGPSEVCTLSLRPEFRRAGRGVLLSLSRFLFMACFPQRFDERVIAELRGFTNEAGASPFWEAIGRHFFAQSFAQADFQSGIGQKDFIRDLMPKYPIYTATLPEEAQAVIGRVHRDAEPALKILLSQGFERTNEVDIFDAGPLVTASRSSIKAVQESQFGEIATVREPHDRSFYLVGHAALNFRACLAPLEINIDKTVIISERTAEILEVAVGDRLIFLALPTRNL